MFDYPHGNMDGVNLDWILAVIAELVDTVNDLETRVEQLENGGA